VACDSLIARLSSQYLSQVVQILINLEFFEKACQELEKSLSSTSARGLVALSATEQFGNEKKTAEERVFELINSKIDDLVDTAEYDWTAVNTSPEPSNYIQTLRRYLSTIMSSILLGLPREIRELIYFDALSHASNKILVRNPQPSPADLFTSAFPPKTETDVFKALPLSPEVQRINANGVAALAQDVQYLSDYVDGLENGPMLKENLDELQQTVDLMQSDNHEEFFDSSMRNKKYGRVDVMNGLILLEK
jgi:hypothetical protein